MNKTNFNLKILIFVFFGLFLMSLNITALLKFKQTYGGKGYDAAHSVLRIDKTGEYIIAGVTSSHSKDGNIDGNIIKLNKAGQIIWNKTLGGSGTEHIKKIIQTQNNNLVIIGHTDSESTNKNSKEVIDQTNLNKVWILKMDLSGKILWSKTYGKVGVSFQITSGISMENDDIVVIGSSISLLGDINSKVYMLRLDKNGKKVWEKHFWASKNNQEGIDLVKTDSGYTILSNIEVKNKWNIWLFHIDNKGKMIWNTSFGGSDNEKANKLLQAKDSGYVIGGYTYSFAKGSLDGWVIRTDKNGKEMWNKVFGGLSTDEIYSIVEMKDESFIAVGYSEPWKTNEEGENSLTSGIDLFIIHFDKSGKSLWVKTWGGEGEQRGLDIINNDNGYSLVGFMKVSEDKGIDMLIMNNSQANDFPF